MTSKMLNYTSRNRDLVTGGAHEPGNLSDPSSSRPRHPSGKTPPRSKGPAPYYRNSASLEGWTPSRAKLRLARGRPEPAARQVSNLGIPRVEFRLDRGLCAPSGGSPPRSRAMRTLGRVSASLWGLAGSQPPRPLPQLEH
jgi:hypothetical protein